MKHGLYVGRPDSYLGRLVDLTVSPTGRLMCFPVLKRECVGADAFVHLVCTCVSFVFLLDSVGQLLPTREVHIPALHKTIPH